MQIVCLTDNSPEMPALFTMQNWKTIFNPSAEPGYTLPLQTV